MSKILCSRRMRRALLLLSFASTWIAAFGATVYAMPRRIYEPPPIIDGGGDLFGPPPTPTPPPCSPGSVDGDAGVSCTGAGTYNIPIKVPPGTAGMAPSLSISYNSQGSGGLLGMGWGLQGLSNISRCSATSALDGFKGAVNFDENDRYCLDGERLIAVAPFGGAVQEYRTQPDNFSRIRSYGTTATGADYFVVETKDGLIQEYGNTTDSKIEAVNSAGQTSDVRTWAIDKTSDRTSNYMLYSYDEDATSGEFRIAEIRYTGNDGAGGVSPYNSVKFLYNYFRIGFDTVPFYQGGSFVITKSLLSNIKTCLNSSCTGTNLVNDYRMDYELGNATKRWRMKSFTECAADGVSGAVSCLPATTLSWNDSGLTDFTANNGSGIGGTSRWTQDSDVFGSKSGGPDSFFKTRTPIYLDAFFPAITAVGQAHDTKSMAIAGAVLAVSAVSFCINPVAGLIGWGIGSIITFTIWYSDSDYFLPKAKLADVNGDGKTDIIELPEDPLIIGVDPRSAFVWLSAKDTSNYQFARQDGTGGRNLWPTDNLTSLDQDKDIQADEVKIGDFDGDGISDLLTFGESEDLNAFVRTSNGSTEFVNNGIQASFLGEIRDVSLGDFNGDGRMDAAQFRGNGAVYINNLTGNQQLYRQDNMETCEYLGLTCDDGDHPIENVLLGDVNGDGKTDIIVFDYSDASNTKANIWLTNRDANGWVSSGYQSPTTTYAFGFGINRVGIDAPDMVLPGDFNGDGKMDLAIFTALAGRGEYDNSGFDTVSASFSVVLSNGRTFVPAPGFLTSLGLDHAPYALKYPDNGVTNVTKMSFLARTSDFNGDGRTDVMILDVLGRAHMLFSNGTKLLPSFQWGSGFGKIDEDMLGDFDGDGRTDLIQFARGNDNAGKLFVSLNNQAPFPDLLVSVKNGLGKEDKFTYKPLTDDSVYLGHTSLDGLDSETINFRGPIYVVSKLQASNGLGGFYTLDYTYTGAKIHRSFGFLGFSSISVSDPQKQLLEVSDYEQRFPLLCRKKAETTYAQSLGDPSPNKSKGPLRATALVSISESSYSWLLIPSSGTHQRIRLDHETHIERELSGQELSDDYISYGYDAFDNITNRTTSWPDVSLIARVEAATYTNNSSSWVLGLPASSVITGQQPVPVAPRTTTFNYDTTTRELNSQIQYLDGGKSVTTSFIRDDFSNPTKITVSGSDFSTREENITYDAFGRFPATRSNALSQVTQFTLNPRFGKVSSLTDPNLLTTSWDYDPFGRLKKITRPDSTTTQINFCTVGDGPFIPANTPSWAQIVTSGEPDRAIYIDALGRETRQSRIGYLGTRVFTDTAFDTSLRLASQSQPYFQGGTKKSTTYTYDSRDRVTSSLAPNGQATTLFYSANSVLQANAIGAPNLTNRLLWHSVTESKTVAGPPDNIYTYTRYIANRLGQLNQVTRFPDAVTAQSTMTYADDADSNPILTADTDGNISSRTFENGKVKTLSDPDLGSWSYTYNALGLLKSQTSSLSTTSFTYDDLNRMLTRSEPEGLNTWSYDSGPMGVGHLTSTTGLNAFSETYEFNSYSRPSVATTIVPGNPTPFTTSFGYDGLGRLSVISYPGSNNFTVRRTYNGFGYLSRVSTVSPTALIWQSETLNAFDDVTDSTQGNGMSSRFTYDSQPALSSVIIGNKINGINLLTPIKKLEYDFDLQGNVLAQHDRTLLPNSERNENFTYDLHDRLRSSFASLNDIQHATEFPLSNQNFSYSAIGNLESKSPELPFIGYNSPGAVPHAPSTVCDTNYCYPAINYTPVGNTSSGRDYHNGHARSILWFSFNKPSYVASDSDEALFGYDTFGNKVFQITSVNVPNSGTQVTKTEYIGQAFERVTLPSGVVEEKHYIYGRGSQPVALFTSRSNGTSEMRYLSYDRLGSLILVSNQDTSTADSLSYDSYGSRRMPNWTPATSPISSVSSRGFTGHEHLDPFGLIDMKGRMYDPTLGRFISPDPFMVEPLLPDAANRFAYVYNDPQKYTDPTGYLVGWEGLAAKSLTTAQSAGIALAGQGLAHSRIGMDKVVYGRDSMMYVHAQREPVANGAGSNSGLSKLTAYKPFKGNADLLSFYKKKSLWDKSVDVAPGSINGFLSVGSALGWAGLSTKSFGIGGMLEAGSIGLDFFDGFFGVKGSCGAGFVCGSTGGVFKLDGIFGLGGGVYFNYGRMLEAMKTTYDPKAMMKFEKFGPK